MIDFPANPNIGDAFQNGNTIYKCVAINPAVWTATVAASGIPEAPTDAKLYGRKSAAWSEVSKTTLGLGNVDNTSDANKPIITATATALAGKEPSIAGGTAAQYWRGDKVFAALNKAAVGLDQVDNTSDANKPVSNATSLQLGTKEPTIPAANASYYYRGDKTWQVLNSGAVGLGNLLNNRQVVDLRNGQNTIYIGWNNGAVDLQIDGTYFGTTWPMNITGRSGTTGRADGQDACNNWGFASGSATFPYMRNAGGTLVPLCYSTNWDRTAVGFRVYAAAPYTFEINGDAGAYGISCAPSDERIKNNIIDSTINATAAVKAMRMIEFDLEGSHYGVGFSAQNLKTVNPLLAFGVAQPEGSPWHQFGVVLNPNVPMITAYLAKALQEALARIDALEAQP
jgi:Chaperone of endosialidase